MKQYHQSKNGKHFRGIVKLVAAVLIGLFLSLWGGEIRHLGSIHTFLSPPAVAQNLRPEQAAAQVYERLSYLPLENQYTSQETREVKADHTLVSRLIRYHIYVKSRSFRSRFDWKLTVADYLGFNEPIQESRYPGYKTLEQNPLSGDRQAFSSLTRRQRSELVEALFSLYNPEAAKLLEQQTSSQETADSQESEESESKPRLYKPKPGDARLLMP